MAASVDITTFAKGEDISALFSLKNRDGTVLTNPATQTVDFVISDVPSDVLAGDLIYEFSSSPQVVLSSEPNAEWTIFIDRADIPILVAELAYNYDIWSTSAGGERLLQVEGLLVLLPAKSPT